MRNAWQRGLGKIDPNALDGRRVIAVDGSFEDFSNAGVEKGSVDLVVIAQAWHWCPDYDKALVCISSSRYVVSISDES